MKIGVMVSGNGSNLQAIIDSIKTGVIKNCEIAGVFSNKKDAYALKRAETCGIKTFYIDYKLYNDRSKYDLEIIRIFDSIGVELVVLAGYLRWLSAEFINRYEGKIINIHPSLLPAFKGLHAIQQAWEYGVKITGVTVHFVDQTEDGGPIILQKAIEIENSDTLESLEQKIHNLEHKMYPYVIDSYVNGKIIKEGRKIKILEK